MSVQAKQLSKLGSRGHDLDTIVREHIQIIDDKLLKAPRVWGRNVISHDIPMLPPMLGLDKKDAQRIVYTAILRSFDRRGFETRILIEENITTIYVAYVTDLDTVEVEAMNALLRARRVTRDALGEFIERGAAPSPRSATAARHGDAPPAPRLRVGSSGVMMPRGGMEPAARREVSAEPALPSAAELSLLGARPRA
jgi:hypothetical protein